MEDKTRLKELRKHLGLTQGEFGKKLGMSDVAISYMESGKTTISDQNLNLICLTFGVNKEWLRDGEGEMMNEDALLSEKESRLMAFFECLSPKAMDMAIGYVEKLLADETAIRGRPLVRKKTVQTRKTFEGKDFEEETAFEREIIGGNISPWKITEPATPPKKP